MGTKTNKFKAYIKTDPTRRITPQQEGSFLCFIPNNAVRKSAAMYISNGVAQQLNIDIIFSNDNVLNEYIEIVLSNDAGTVAIAQVTVPQVFDVQAKYLSRVNPLTDEDSFMAYISAGRPIELSFNSYMKGTDSHKISMRCYISNHVQIEKAVGAFLRGSQGIVGQLDAYMMGTQIVPFTNFVPAYIEGTGNKNIKSQGAYLAGWDKVTQDAIIVLVATDSRRIFKGAFISA